MFYKIETKMIIVLSVKNFQLGMSFKRGNIRKRTRSTEQDPINPQSNLQHWELQKNRKILYIDTNQQLKCVVLDN